MKRVISLFLATIFISVMFSSCNLPVEEISNITKLEFAFDMSPMTMEAGKTKTGYIRVKATSDFAENDIKFVSSDPTVATFSYDKTVNHLVYYKINALRSGETTVYAQTLDGNIKTTELSVQVKGYIYDIVSYEDISVARAKRMRLRVTSKEDYINSMDDATITDMMKYITTQYASSHKVNAVFAFLYYEGDDTSGGFTVASCTYAPYGKVGKAVDVKAGDYSTFDFDITVNSMDKRDIYRQPK